MVFNYGVLIGLYLLSFILILLAFKRKSKVLILIATLPVALGIYETGGKLFTSNQIQKRSGSFYDNPAIANYKEGLGYGPVGDSSFCARDIVTVDNDTIMNTEYCFSNGIRVHDKKAPNSSDQKLYILGGSYAFGAGLHDEQTLAYKLSQNGNYEVYNYAFAGYGTHQALFLVENELKIDNNSTIYYHFIPDHSKRAAGKAIWDTKGPFYDFEKDSLVFKGRFDKNNNHLNNKVLSYMRKIWINSYLHQSLWSHRYQEKDIKRIEHMILRLSRATQLKGGKFYMTAKTDPYFDKMYFDLIQKRVNLHTMNDIIPDLNTNPRDYSIRKDSHPNERYNDSLANHLLKWMR